MLTTTVQSPPEADSERRKKVGHYILGSVLGEGSFAKVRVGTHIISREKVAVKIVPKRLMIQRESARRHFRREALLLQRVSHPHIVQLLEAMETPNCYYLVFELAGKGHLQSYVTDRKCLEEEEARHFMRQVVSAVDHLHQSGIVHRDLKLENFLLNSSLDIKIVDFGLSSLCQRHNSLHTQCGSPAYAAPEIFSSRRYGAAVDLWSLGVCLYAMVTGRLPFLPEHPPNLAQLHAVILHGATIPSFLTSALQELLKGLLEIHESNRLTITDMLQHTWITCSGTKPITRHAEVAKAPPIVIDTNVVKFMTMAFRFNESDVIHSVTDRKLNASSATYHLLRRRLQGGQNLVGGPQAAGNSGNLLAVPVLPSHVLSRTSKESDVPDQGSQNGEKNAEGARDYKDCILFLKEARNRRLAQLSKAHACVRGDLGEVSERRSSLPRLPSLSTSYPNAHARISNHRHHHPHQGRSRQLTPTDAVRTSVYPDVTRSLQLNVSGLSPFQGKKTSSGSAVPFVARNGSAVTSLYAHDLPLPPPPPNTAYGARGREQIVWSSDQNALKACPNPDKASRKSPPTLKDPFGPSQDSWNKQDVPGSGGENEARRRNASGASYVSLLTSPKALLRRAEERVSKAQGYSVTRQIAADFNRKQSSRHGPSPHTGEVHHDPDHVSDLDDSVDYTTTSSCDDDGAREVREPTTDIPYSESMDREEFPTPVIRVTITSTNRQ